MWIKENHYVVSTEERQRLNVKLEEVYAQYGQVIRIERNPPSLWQDTRAIAYLQCNHMTGELTLHCGEFWEDEDNLCPVIAMAHELGHYMDVTENFFEDFTKYNQTLGTLELEVRAWEKAYYVLKAIDFNHWEVFYSYAEKCLGSYFGGARWGGLPNDRRFNFQGKSPTFTEGKNRLRSLVGMELIQEVEEPQRPSIQDMWEELSRQFGGGRGIAQIQPKVEEELSPLDRMRKQKEKYRRSVKEGMGAKSWEL
jgi:hypothetical protein